MMHDSGPASYRGKRRWRASTTRGAMLKIISGGQTGVDHAALDAAIEQGIAYAAGARKAAEM
jgi:predicted Rossmann fold nucleotide-binding protein DprA/Smf involved in DNA uptake